jgi:Inner membrane protein YgaP-like, transmembrane domain
MKRWQNMGTLDRALRAVAGVVLVALGALVGLSVLWTAVVYVVGALMLVTSALGFCPAYLPLGLHTRHPGHTGPKAA